MRLFFSSLSLSLRLSLRACSRLSLCLPADDDDIECVVSIVPKDPFEKVDLPLPDTLLPPGITADEPTLAATLARLPASAELARIVEMCVAAAGPDGSQLGFLERVAEDQAARTGTAANLPGAIALLTTRAEPPLAFWAGKSSLRLVHARFVGQWALPLASDAAAAAAPEGAPAGGRWFLPTFWSDVEGRVNVEYWARACAWIKGELWKRSGSTCVRLSLSLLCLSFAQYSQADSRSLHPPPHCPLAARPRLARHAQAGARRARGAHGPAHARRRGQGVARRGLARRGRGRVRLGAGPLGAGRVRVALSE